MKMTKENGAEGFRTAKPHQICLQHICDSDASVSGARGELSPTGEGGSRRLTDEVFCEQGGSSSAADAGTSKARTLASECPATISLLSQERVSDAAESGADVAERSVGAHAICAREGNGGSAENTAEDVKEGSATEAEDRGTGSMAESIALETAAVLKAEVAATLKTEVAAALKAELAALRTELQKQGETAPSHAYRVPVMPDFSAMSDAEYYRAKLQGDIGLR